MFYHTTWGSEIHACSTQYEESAHFHDNIMFIVFWNSHLQFVTVLMSVCFSLLLIHFTLLQFYLLKFAILHFITQVYHTWASSTTSSSQPASDQLCYLLLPCNKSFIQVIWVFREKSRANVRDEAHWISGSCEKKGEVWRFWGVCTCWHMPPPHPTAFC
jgi:hypothetical protein